MFYFLSILFVAKNKNKKKKKMKKEKNKDLAISLVGIRHWRCNRQNSTHLANLGKLTASVLFLFIGIYVFIFE